MYAARFHSFQAFYSGLPLPHVEALVVEAKSQMRLYKQDNSHEICNHLHQFVYNLTTRRDDGCKLLAGDICGTGVHSENMSLVAVHLSLSTILSFLFRDLDLAEQFAQARQDLKVRCVYYSTSIDVLLNGMIAVGQARRGFRRRRNLRIARRCLTTMRSFAKDCSENFLNKQKLLEAELSSLSGRKSVTRQANELYGEAYRLACNQGFIFEAALTCELAGDYMHAHEVDRALAQEYWEEAHARYVEWGAEAKVRHLRTRIDCHAESNELTIAGSV
jgi:hypothetical protein